MRIAASLFLLAMAAPAHADDDKGLSLDLGYARNRVAVTDRTALDASLVRFGMRISLGRYFHFGAEAEEGGLAGTTSLPGGAVARTSSGTPGPLDGNTLGLKLYAGVHATAGAFMFGADVAGGMRDTWVSSDLGPDVAGRKSEPLLEARSRADIWVGSRLTVGVVVGTDVLERRDVSLGVVLSLHLGN